MWKKLRRSWLYMGRMTFVQDGKVTCFVADMCDDTWEAFEDAIRDIPSHAAFEAMGITKVKVGSYT